MIEAAAATRRPLISILTPSRERLERLAAWFREEYPAMLRFAYFLTGDPHAAEDLVQEAFVRLERSAGRPEDERFGAYARRTLANLAHSAQRRRAIERRAAVPALVAAEPPDPGARDEVWRAILRLSPRQRAVIALRYYEDLSEREIAETLQMSAGAVKKHADRAMARLRELLGRDS